MTRYCAKRVPEHRGPAAWNLILPAQRSPVILDHEMTADFTIVGGGFAGISAARRLRQLQPDARIVVLEASRIAEGASGRNSGFMIDLPHDLASHDYSGGGISSDRTMIDLNRQAIAFVRDSVDDYGIDPNYFDEAGKVNGAASPSAHAHNISYAKHLDTLGEQSEMLDQMQMRHLTGSPHYIAGLFTPGTVMLQPAGLVRGMVDGLRRDDVLVFENSPVRRFEKAGSSWTVSTRTGTISTDRIILANNGHLESFGIKSRKLMHVFLYASMTCELGEPELKKLGGQARWGITPSDPMGTTMRRIDAGQGGNRIVTRTCATLRRGMTASADDLSWAAKAHQRKFDERFPQLAGMRQEFSWAGHICLSLNGVSVMGELDDGIWSACVQNGLGTARGTLTGIGAAELACGKTSEISDYFTSEAEPKKLPPEPFASLGANVWMRYKEWRAARE